MVTATEPPGRPARSKQCEVATTTVAGQWLDWLLFLILGSVAGAIIYFVVTSLHL